VPEGPGDPQVFAAAEREAREQGWHQGANQTVIGIGPVPWWLRRPATKPEILALLAELDTPRTRALNSTR
jgi:hypothetical protein